MVSPVSVLLVLFAATLIQSYPQAPKNENNALVTCAEGEIINADGKCVKQTAEISKPVIDPEKKAKREKKKALKKRKLRKQLNLEIKEIKKMVLDGLEKGVVNLQGFTCPEGQELNDQGECGVKNVVETDPKKAQKRQRLQKKLEKELEIVLKKEIQNELRRKRRNKKKEAKKTTGNSENSRNVETPNLPLCDESKGITTDCAPLG